VSAPLLLIILPLAASFGLFLLRYWRRLSTLVALGMALFFCILTMVIPSGDVITIGTRVIPVAESLSFFGRQFLLSKGDLAVLTLIYGSLAFWQGAAYEARTHWAFTPLSLAIAAMLTSVLAVKPFLYAALLIEGVTLLSIPVIITPGQKLGPGVLRFLAFQTLGMPFILYTGWMLGGMEMGLPQPDLAVRSAVMMAIGFVLLLGIFPFHTWMPMVMDEGHPYACAFVFYMFSLVALLFGVGLIQSYQWLRVSQTIHLVVALAGVLMILMGGIGAAFQEHFGRILGYTMMTEIGFSLLAIGFSFLGNLYIFFALLPPRILGLGVWALSLSGIRERRRDLSFTAQYGAAGATPICAFGIALANLSALGFPLMGGFPPRLTLWQFLSVQNPLVLGGVLVGVLGLLLSFIRSMVVLFAAYPTQAENVYTEGERPWMRLAILLGCLGLLFLGLFPQWITPLILSMQRMFQTPLP
jgi:NADH-quinone oxidoreductase subunit N